MPEHFSTPAPLLGGNSRATCPIRSARGRSGLALNFPHLDLDGVLA
jgi:hypothetical protein